MMLAGTAASVGLALANDRRLTPVFVEAASQPRGVPAPPPRAAAGDGLRSAARAFLARRFALATLIGAAVLIVATSIPAVTAIASSIHSPAAAPPSFGPPMELRAGAGVDGNWEQSYSMSAPPADQIGSAVIAGNDVLRALQQIADQRAADERAAQAQTRSAATFTANSASGFAPGTVVRARITIYGCTGPGGGFCNHMSSGGAPFEGAAACSNDLPIGTKVTIAGDPTGRVYECLDRGALAATWIDVFFFDTSDGMLWQSQLGTTMTDITIVN